MINVSIFTLAVILLAQNVQAQSSYSTSNSSSSSDSSESSSSSNSCRVSVKVAASGNSTYIYNVCTETSQPAAPNDCVSVRTGPNNNYKNGQLTNMRLWTGFEENFPNSPSDGSAQFGFHEYAIGQTATSQQIKTYIFTRLNTNAIGASTNVIDAEDCPNMLVKIVGYSHGGVSVARAIKEIFDTRSFGGGKTITEGALAGLKVQMGLIDPVVTQRPEALGGTNLPEQACIIEIKQSAGCPGLYCRQKGAFGSMPLPSVNVGGKNYNMFTGYPYGNVDHVRDMTGETVTTQINGYSQTQTANHLNIEVAAKNLANHIANTDYDSACTKPSDWP